MAERREFSGELSKRKKLLGAENCFALHGAFNILLERVITRTETNRLIISYTIKSKGHIRAISF
jgi:hypothetical protein